MKFGRESKEVEISSLPLCASFREVVSVTMIINYNCRDNRNVSPQQVSVSDRRVTTEFIDTLAEFIRAESDTGAESGALWLNKMIKTLKQLSNLCLHKSTTF